MNTEVRAYIRIGAYPVSNIQVLLKRYVFPYYPSLTTDFSHLRRKCSGCLTAPHLSKSIIEALPWSVHLFGGSYHATRHINFLPLPDLFRKSLKTILFNRCLCYQVGRVIDQCLSTFINLYLNFNYNYKL